MGRGGLWIGGLGGPGRGEAVGDHVAPGRVGLVGDLDELGWGGPVGRAVEWGDLPWCTGWGSSVGRWLALGRGGRHSGGKIAKCDILSLYLVKMSL